MTNEQTRIFLNSYRRHLESAIEQAKELLPKEVMETREVHSVIFPSVSCVNRFSNGRCPDGHYKTETVCVALEPLYAVLSSIDEDLEALEVVKKAS